MPADVPIFEGNELSSMNIGHVILVDADDNPLGTMEKMEAHRRAVLHRAVSVFIVNSRGEWLLQQRAYHKYHSPGLWTNSCCTHPFPGESNGMAAKRRLREEMGMECKLTKIFDFVYREELEGGLTEHEFDHVYVGFCDDDPKPDPEEVANWRRMDYKILTEELSLYPNRFTIWFRLIAGRVHHNLQALSKEYLLCSTC